MGINEDAVTSAKMKIVINSKILLGSLFQTASTVLFIFNALSKTL